MLISNCAVLPPISTSGLGSQDVGTSQYQCTRFYGEVLARDFWPCSSSAYPADHKPATSTAPSQSDSKQQQSQIPATTPTPTESDPSSPVNESRSESRASTYASDFPPGSPVLSRFGGSENGVETEEDEGMVLVGRPQS
ncbi:hypothetical protein QCA50_000856 [Cerrena zonata]|uniref:Uncharacterized protein n=1 Tax=Cerrena zonata TaxID=2478898 RepID=A0AAW0GS08_9APHY